MRFHMGVSFRLKTLKKFIWPVLIGLLAYFFGSGVITAKAEDYITQTQLLPQDISYCDVPITDYIDYFERIKSDNYEFFVSYNGSSVAFNFYPSIPSTGGVKPINTLTASSGIVDWFKLGSTTENYNGYARYNTFTLSLNSTKCENIDFRDSVIALSDFTDWMESYHDFYTNYQTIFSNINVTNFIGSSSYRNGTGNTVYVSEKNGYYNVYVEYDYTVKGQYLLYSSRPTYYDENPTYLTFDIYPKKLMLNGKLYSTGDVMDWGYQSQEELKDYSYIKDVFIYDNVSNLSTLNFKLNFNPLDSNFSYAYYPVIYYAYGQVYHSGTESYNPYITFDKIDVSKCNFTYRYNRSSDYITLEIDSFNCPSGTFTGYTLVSLDLIFEYGDYTYKPSNLFYNYSLSSDSIQTYINDSKINIQASGFFPYTNGGSTSSNNKVFVSSYNNYTDIVYGVSDSKYFMAIPYTLDTLTLVNPSMSDLLWDKPYIYGNIGKNLNQGILFTTNPEQDSTYKLSIFFNEGVILSLTSNNNVCGYNGSFNCSSININYDDNPPEDNYDVDSYFIIVSDFIDSISNDMVNFGGLVQSVYDTIPPFISSFFVVLYILGNSYLVYKLII